MTRPVNLASNSISNNNDAEPVGLPSIYRAELNPANSPLLNQQFRGLVQRLGRQEAQPEDYRQAVSQLFAERNIGVTVSIDQSAWPVAYFEDSSCITIHPAFLTLCNHNPQARLFAITEVFDKVIYAQLHNQALHVGTNSNITPAEGDDLLALVEIKGVKQEESFVRQRGTDTGEESSDETIVDPTSAWLVASPRFASESRCVEGYTQAFNAFMAGQINLC